MGSPRRATGLEFLDVELESAIAIYTDGTVAATGDTHANAAGNPFPMEPRPAV